MRLYIEQWGSIKQGFFLRTHPQGEQALEGVSKKLNKASDRSLTITETPGYYPRPLERQFLKKCPEKWRF